MNLFKVSFIIVLRIWYFSELIVTYYWVCQVINNNFPIICIFKMSRICIEFAWNLITFISLSCMKSWHRSFLLRYLKRNEEDESLEWGQGRRKYGSRGQCTLSSDIVRNRSYLDQMEALYLFNIICISNIFLSSLLEVKLVFLKISENWNLKLILMNLE